MNKENIQAFDSLIQRAERILIISHTRPDGDAVGSLIGLGLIFEELGKEVNLVLEDGVPKVFHHLPSYDKVFRETAGVYDLIVVVDCSDIDRIGNVLDEYGEPDVNIDHHPTNTRFARVNLVQEDAVATAEMIYDLAEELSFPLNKAIAEALLTGLITDSLGFRTSNTSPKSLRIAADLQELGADLPDLHRKALGEKSLEAVKYWGQGLAKINQEDRLVWTSLSLDDRKQADYTGRDDADLINVLSMIRDTDISLVFVEQTNGTVKVSWRARPGFDVSKIAIQFGGGGHIPASGAEIEGKLEKVQEEVLQATKNALNGSG
ncbi:MAG: bifunctional oligoribonuclease/PAP phosphatase NrnA [Anaerolineales bacterium]